MLGREMPGDPCVIDDRERNKPLRPRPGQCFIAGKKTGETRRRDEERKNNEAHRLHAQEWPIRLGAVRQPCAAQAVTDPKEGGEGKVKIIKRTLLGLGIAVREPEDNRRQPERALHPKAVP